MNFFGQNRQEFYNDPQYVGGPNQGDKRSGPMTTAAVILSTIAISTVCCIYLSLVCGVLGVIFALLSKGGELTMSQNAKTALWISIFAIVLTIALLVGSFMTVIMQYGSIEAFWKAYMEMVDAYMTNPNVNP